MTGSQTEPGPRRGSAALPEVALRLFDEFGFDAVTTEQIAIEAGVNPRTFFRHFATKFDVLMAGTGDRQKWFIERLYGQPPGLGVVEALTLTICEEDALRPMNAEDVVRSRILRGSTSLMNSLRLFESGLEQAFAAWIAQRTKRRETDFEVHVAASVLVAVRRAVIREWQAAEGARSVGDIATKALAYVHLEIDDKP